MGRLGEMAKTKTWGTGSASRQPGYTLIELVVSLTILTLFTLALPLAFQRLQPERSVRIQSQSIIAELRALRGEAMRSGRSMSWRAADVSVSLLSVEGEHGAGDAMVTFFPSGLCSGAHIEIGDERATRTIHVSALTGRVWVD